MAKFSINDYVSVTPKPDFHWSEWDNDVHTLYCGRIGYIDEIVNDPFHPDDRDEDYVRVVVEFNDNTFSKPGYYYTYFKKRHLIKSSEYELQRYGQKRTASEETNHFEKFTKDKRDEIYRHIFGIKEKKEELPLDDKELFEDWDVKTENIFGVDDGSDPFI